MKTKTHYIAMAGIGGCLPNFCEVYETEKQAVEGLDALCELSRQQKRELRLYGLTDLTKAQGNEYAEVVECDCNEPGGHQDDMTVEQFRKNNPEFYPEGDEEERK